MTDTPPTAQAPTLADLQALLEAATAGPWVYSTFCKPDGQPIESVEDVATAIAESARKSPRSELWGVSLNDAAQHPDGLATVVCYTGNGPNAHNNARLMAAAPWLVQRLLQAEGDLRTAREAQQQAERERDELREKLDGWVEEKWGQP